jgi:2-polyprenyl-3-methyl-5-hydroxy-6-metoxy-1,4-benzoquinol methylase
MVFLQGMTLENHSGARAVLKAPWAYRMLQALVGKSRALRHLHESVWSIQPGFKLIDIGCGPRPMLDSIPFSIDYIGIDLDAAYIASAKAQHGNRGTFLIGTTKDYMDDPRMHGADLILCNGVLHHLPDLEVHELIDFVAKHLKPETGRFTAIEPCHLVFESRLSTWIMNQDRGRFVRSEEAWKQLFSENAGIVYRTRIMANMIRIPYFHVIIDCWKKQ